MGTFVWLTAAGALLLLPACGDGDGDSPSDLDSDGDGVVDDLDPDPDFAFICGIGDDDGCDDCSLEGSRAPGNDGYDPDGDGVCELALDRDCVHGEHAADDPSRLEACAMLAIANADRRYFSAESGAAAPLVWSEAIWEVAIAHSRDMCEAGFFEHENLLGQDPSDRAAAAGLEYGLSENIALNLDPRSAAFGLMSEPTCVGHRLNLLDPRSVEVGIGYHLCHNPDYSPWGQHHHITQDFRVDFSLARSDYCLDPATACELPGNPPSTAVCPPEVLDFGFCAPVEASLLNDWGCPVD